ncbi:hypothetical protein ANO11243_065630 [Dothideomycetidae sp. 11243]|nr:hypothetical protein ANO11243_065630 [fungal sp. No.11243]
MIALAASATVASSGMLAISVNPANTINSAGVNAGSVAQTAPAQASVTSNQRSTGIIISSLQSQPVTTLIAANAAVSTSLSIPRTATASPAITSLTTPITGLITMGPTTLSLFSPQIISTAPLVSVTLNKPSSTVTVSTISFPTSTAIANPLLIRTLPSAIQLKNATNGTSSSTLPVYITTV